MDCDGFRERFSFFTTYPMERRVTESGEFQRWHDHLNDCRSCKDLYLEHEARKLNLSNLLK